MICCVCNKWNLLLCSIYVFPLLVFSVSQTSRSATNANTIPTRNQPSRPPPPPLCVVLERIQNVIKFYRNNHHRRRQLSNPTTGWPHWLWLAGEKRGKHKRNISCHAMPCHSKRFSCCARINCHKSLWLAVVLVLGCLFVWVGGTRLSTQVARLDVPPSVRVKVVARARAFACAVL